jgi:hypothetical protein
MVDSAETMLSKKQIGKNPSESKKEIMEITKDKLFSAIADLVEKLVFEYGCEEESIIHILTYYGFTKEQIEEWYGITGE